MTKDEICKNYNMPAEILDRYKTDKKDDAYTDSDLEEISLIMTLYDSGFSDFEVSEYMKLRKCGNNKSRECLCLLEKKRNGTLDEIHIKEKQIENIDCLKYKIRNGGKNNE